MKLLFICPGLEPGRDGVGDYTRLLAAACAARGHECTLIALHDPHVTTAKDTNEASTDLRLIRLSATTPWPDRLIAAATHVRRLAPDWVSWQLVAQGLHPRGFLPAALLAAAPTLRGPACHVMLHELWLGLEQRAPLRHRLLGALQRRNLLCLLARLAPDRIHTSNTAYATVLVDAGYDPEILPLFGNLPVAPPHPQSFPFATWLPFPTTGDLPALIGVTFGTLHPQWQPAATIAWFNATAHRLRRSPFLVALGRSGPRTPAILDAFRAAGISAIATGELPPAHLSRTFQAAHFGIAPHPWALLDKSGAAAAMLDHGLPVLAPRDDWHLRSNFPRTSPDHDDPLLARLADLTPTTTTEWLAARRPPDPALPAITTTFLQTLHPTLVRT